jgi:hypothetical protein
MSVNTELNLNHLCPLEQSDADIGFLVGLSMNLGYRVPGVIMTDPRKCEDDGCNDISAP